MNETTDNNGDDNGEVTRDQRNVNLTSSHGKVLVYTTSAQLKEGGVVLVSSTGVRGISGTLQGLRPDYV